MQYLAPHLCVIANNLSLIIVNVRQHEVFTIVLSAFDSFYRQIGKSMRVSGTMCSIF